MSSFHPLRALKGKSIKGTASSPLRRVLVSVQFASTILLIIGTITINRQLHFIRQQKLGFNQEQVISIRLQSGLGRQVDVIKNELLRDAHVKSACAASYLPTKIRRSSSISAWEGSSPDDEVLVYYLSADHDLTATLEIQMAEGRYFSRDVPIDTTEGIVVNETAVKAMGLDLPLGRSLLNSRIIGVVKDFHFQSMHSQIEPLVIYFNPIESRFLLIRINPGNIEEAIQSIKQRWQLLAPNTPFEYSFLDEEIQQLYFREKRVEAILNGFTVLAIVIACLGLFGLASFTAEQRTKEVGVRKVLGASVMQLVALLSKEFTRYVLLANILAWPLAWYFTHQWLQNFAYHINMSWWIFVLAGISALLIALLTISWQAIRAANINPVKSLRYE